MHLIPFHRVCVCGATIGVVCGSSVRCPTFCVRLFLMLFPLYAAPSSPCRVSVPWSRRWLG